MDYSRLCKTQNSLQLRSQAHLLVSKGPILTSLVLALRVAKAPQSTLELASLPPLRVSQQQQQPWAPAQGRTYSAGQEGGLLGWQEGEGGVGRGWGAGMAAVCCQIRHSLQATSSDTGLLGSAPTKLRAVWSMDCMEPTVHRIGLPVKQEFY